MVNATPRSHYSQETGSISVIREAVWVPGRVYTAAEIITPSGFYPRYVQTVASRSADYANPAHEYDIVRYINIGDISLDPQHL